MSKIILVIFVLLAVLPHFYIVPQFMRTTNDEKVKEDLAFTSLLISLCFIVVGILYILGYLIVIGTSWLLLVPVLVAGILLYLSLSMGLEVDPDLLNGLKNKL